MAFIKQESEDIKIEEVYSLKQEDTEGQTDSCGDTEDDAVGGRKRKNGRSWMKCVNKKKRMMGQPYVGMRGNEEVNMEPRVMGPRCQSAGCIKSSKHHCSTIGEADRENIFKSFWEKMNWEEKRMYVRGLVDVVPVQRKRGRDNSRRLSTLIYFLNVDGQRRRVCKSFFLSTLGLGEWSALNWVQDTGNTQQNAGSHLRREDREFMKSFLQELPKVTSCKCRSSASKQNLVSGFQSMSSLYQVYHHAAEGKMLRPFSRQVFSEEFKQQKLALFYPKKNKCKTCCPFKVKKEEACVVNVQDENDTSVKTEIKSEW